VEDIKIRKIGWAGHMRRIEEERIPKRVLNENFHTTRPFGRPRTRWATWFRGMLYNCWG
jgi:hypothetical protein